MSIYIPQDNTVLLRLNQIRFVYICINVIGVYNKFDNTHSRSSKNFHTYFYGVFLITFGDE